MELSVLKTKEAGGGKGPTKRDYRSGRWTRLIFACCTSFACGPAVLLLGSCQPTAGADSPASAATEMATASRSQQPDSPARVELPPLNEDEKVVFSHLTRHVEQLAVHIGERSVAKPFQLAEGADYIAAQLAEMGYEVEREGYEAGEVVAQNVSVTILGGRFASQVLVVGAHYHGGPGAAGRASAVSTGMLLELARLMKGALLERSVRFCFFALPETEHYRSGAEVLAEKMRVAQEAGPPVGAVEPLAATYQKQTVGMMELADFLAPGLGAETDFPLGTRPVGWRASGNALEFSHVLREALAGEPTLLVEAPFTSTLAGSDAAPFFKRGVPVVRLGSSIEGGKVETALHLDVWAHFTMRIRRGLSDILGEKPQNDGMVTPILAPVR